MDACKEHKKRTGNLEMIINGNGKLGMAAKVNLLYEWMLATKATKNGVLDWTFRMAISILLAFIAVKVGLKS